MKHITNTEILKKSCRLRLKDRHNYHKKIEEKDTIYMKYTSESGSFILYTYVIKSISEETCRDTQLDSNAKWDSQLKGTYLRCYILLQLSNLT
jgi:hypothetical protein